jgi:hypothetical protein
MEIEMRNLTSVFGNVNGNTVVGLTTRTNVTLKGGKKNPLQGRVTKVMEDANVMVFQNKNVNGYENMVKRRLSKEGKDAESFVLGSRVWGTRIAGTPVVEHNGKQYLEAIFLNSGKVHYEVDGKTVPMSEITGLESVTEGEQGGLDNKVIVRTFAEDSIVKVRINGKTVV